MIAEGPGVVRVRQVSRVLHTVADDAGALLVRSGLVSSNALDDARARVANVGGTLGEQLVTNGAITDDDLTDFYRSRLLVPQVNPNLLARLTPKVVATIPSDMAIELRAIPVSLDGDNNLTVAMSDPSDRHAVDEIAFFTGAYVVRAVATQMQIAWCLAHYYGHVTALGQRLLYATGGESPAKPTGAAASQRLPRPKGSELEQRPSAAPEAPAMASDPASASLPTSTSAPYPVSVARLVARVPTPPTPISMPASAPRIVPPTGTSTSPPAPRATPSTSTPAVAPRPTPSTSPPAVAPRPTPSTSTPAVAPRPTPSTSTPAGTPAVAQRTPPASTPTPPTPISMPASAPRIVSPTGDPTGTSISTPAAAPAEPDDRTPVIIEIDGDSDEAAASDGEKPGAPTSTPASSGPPDRPRARSVSGEIRVPVRRAPSIRPPMPEPDSDDDEEPLIVIEPGSSDDDPTGARPMPPRRRAVKSDPPELYARAGEVDLPTGGDHSIDVDEPRIVIDEDALATPTAVNVVPVADPTPVEPPVTTMEVLDDTDTGALIHDRIIDTESQPILLERPRGTPDQLRPAAPGTTAPAASRSGQAGPDDADTGEINIVVLEARKPSKRPERRTQVGIPPAPVPVTRMHRDTEASGIPTMLEHAELDRTVPVDEDATTLDTSPGAPDDAPTSQRAGIPAGPAGYDERNPNIIAPPPPPAPPRSTAIQQAMIIDDDDDHDDDDDDDPGDRDGEAGVRRTSVMSALELDSAILGRTAEVGPAHLSRRRLDHDPVDDGWGPPGTTIPPPLLGAIPGSEDADDDAPSAIPMPDVDSLPLVVGPPSLPSASDAGGRGLVRALEEATARAIEVIRQLERAETRDEVVNVMISHLAENHHRAGFFVTRPGVAKGVTELSLFAMLPRPAVMPFATLRLDRPSTLQDVVGTRLPYRGPMHDDASRTFLVSILGACPPEILLVPVAVRERVVGVLFGEHRQRHTFDDQLALAARAAGMALERILKAKRG